MLSFLRAVHGRLHGGYKDLLQHFKLLFVPVVNPDGVAYMLKNNNPNIRKNRRRDDQCDEDVAGVDLNRNFATGFGLL